MISQLSPTLHSIATQIDPKDLLLTRNAWVKFTNSWPDSPSKWATGRLFRVYSDPILVQYPVTRLVVKDNYIDLDLSNATNGLNLYPENEYILYQIAVGMSSGDYEMITYVPADKYAFRLGQSSMFPSLTSATLVHLGSHSPADSPVDSPLFYLYVVKDAPEFIQRLIVSTGVEYEKMTLKFFINKCQLREIERPKQPESANDPSWIEFHRMEDRAMLLNYYTDMSGF